MQFSQKTFGSQQAIKELYRQNSALIKNTQKDKNGIMSQSSNIPFNKIYNAFNSTGHLKNFGLDRFKNSQAQSIIQKLLQTNKKQPNHQEQELLILNQLQNLQINDIVDSKQPIPLNSTQNKIFCEVINLITQINEIQQQTEKQTEEFEKTKIQLKKQGIQFPQIQQNKNQLSNSPFIRRFTKEQLVTMFEENEKLQKQIQILTKQLTNNKFQSNEEKILQNLKKTNSVLKKQLSTVKSQILNSGEFDQEQINNISQKVENLRQQVFVLEQKRFSTLFQKDQQLNYLKNQNQKLRLKTIQILRKHSDSKINKKKLDLIRALQIQEQNKRIFVQQMNTLKSKYNSVIAQNQRLKRQETSLINQYDGPLQVESKVSPFRNTYGQFKSSFGYDRQSFSRKDKQNYFMNYQPDRNRRQNYSNSIKQYSKWQSRY